MSFTYAKRIIKKQPYFFNNLRFGFSTALNIYFYECKPTEKNTNKKIKSITKFAQKTFKPIIKKYKTLENNIVLQQHNKKFPIWIFWSQGKDFRPDMVKLCGDSVEKYFPKEQVEINFVNKDNFSNYVDIPDYIVKKHKIGKIGMAHFSDVIRFALLAKYGGMWLDATMLVTDYVDFNLLKSDLFTLKIYDENKYYLEPSKVLWNNFIWATKPNNPLFLFGRDCLFYFWKKYNRIVDYVFLDYIIITAKNNFDSIKTQLDNIKPNVKEMSIAYLNIHKKYTPELLEQINNNTIFNKLDLRATYKEHTENGELTLYGYFKKIIENKP